jgi:hypothetical protein
MARDASDQKLSQWRARLRRFAQSKLSVAEFCRREGVSAPSFYQWRRKLKDASANRRKRQSPLRANFVPVEVAMTTGLEVRFPNGTQLSLPASDRELIRLTIQAIALAQTGPGDA